MCDDYTFYLCLTHDVDRPYKRLHHTLYYTQAERSLSHLKSLLPSVNPYWQFEDIMAIEEEFGVTSAFYFLNEQHILQTWEPRRWLRPIEWVQFLGRYDVTSPAIADMIRTLDAGGWEIGIHGSFHSYDDRARLHHEKEVLEAVAGTDVVGGRQHYLRLSIPETWRHHRAIGLDYDASLGDSTRYGFHHGYHPVTPFDDDFLVFPLTLMEQALEQHSSVEARRAVCDRLLTEAADHQAVMTVLWHPRYFNEEEFPGFRFLYRWLIERALELGAWVGPPGALCERFQS
ncbi:polysaccharide deacetylase family protein [Halorarius litoreus]|uniref:polysaccharide deacetylase family protein n=1 Tax=Halorarius litoreus TaxID=2962676 RepID=UPI0020CC57AB|nr:polysaccharide deacetylase family protein [Halorarius litoreus]